MSKLSYKITIFGALAGQPLSAQQPVNESRGKWQLLRTVTVLVLGLSVIIALLLAAFVIALILAIPLIAASLYSLGRLGWRRWLGPRNMVL